MKIIQKVKRDFTELEPSAKADFMDNVANEMTTNTDTFTAPDPALTVLTDDAKNIREHYNASRNGNQDEVALMNKAIEKADTDLRTEATYVDLVAKGDETIINKAGFKATKAETTPSQPPTKSQDFTVNPGNSRGVLILELGKLEFANFYTFVIGRNLSGVSFRGNAVVVNSATDVIVLTSKRLKVTIKELESNVAYECFVFGTSSAAGKGEKSATITVSTF